MHTLPATHLPSQRRRLLLQCALFAKQEIFGYLLNDCVEGILLYSDDALSVGQRGDNAAAKAKAVLKVKAKRDVAEVRHTVLAAWLLGRAATR